VKWTEVVANLGLRGLHFHDLRHAGEHLGVQGRMSTRGRRWGRRRPGRLVKAEKFDRFSSPMKGPCKVRLQQSNTDQQMSLRNL
jgi:hypothetical protein